MSDRICVYLCLTHMSGKDMRYRADDDLLYGDMFAMTGWIALFYADWWD